MSKNSRGAGAVREIDEIEAPRAPLPTLTAPSETGLAPGLGGAPATGLAGDVDYDHRIGFVQPEEHPFCRPTTCAICDKLRADLLAGAREHANAGARSVRSEAAAQLTAAAQAVLALAALKRG